MIYGNCRMGVDLWPKQGERVPCRNRGTELLRVVGSPDGDDWVLLLCPTHFLVVTRNMSIGGPRPWGR